MFGIGFSFEYFDTGLEGFSCLDIVDTTRRVDHASARLDVDGEVDFVDVEFHATIFELVGCKIGFIAKPVDNETRFVAMGVNRVTEVFGCAPRAIVGADRTEDVLSAKTFVTLRREIECVVVGMDKWGKFVFVSVDRGSKWLRIR